MLRLLRYVVLSFVFMGSSLGAALADTSPPQVHVFSCQVFSGAPFTPLSDAVGLAVRFQNDSPDELASVVWRANYGKYPVDFIDDGSFAPSARIDNYVLFERGTTHFNAGSAIGDLLPLFGRPNPTVGSNSMWSSNMALGPYFGRKIPKIARSSGSPPRPARSGRIPHSRRQSTIFRPPPPNHLRRRTRRSQPPIRQAHRPRSTSRAVS